jgi:hypothetical protein
MIHGRWDLTDVEAGILHLDAATTAMQQECGQRQRLASWWRRVPSCVGVVRPRGVSKGDLVVGGLGTGGLRRHGGRPGVRRAGGRPWTPGS